MKKIFSLLMISILMIGMAGCSKDDEPSDYQPTYNGVEVYMNAIIKLYNEEGKPAFTPTTTEGIYVGVADDENIAYHFICQLIANDKWDGKNVTISLGENGELGSLKVITVGLEEGVYDEIVVNIEGDTENYEPYKLQIISEEKAASDNGIIGEGSVVIKIN